jgi:hypothetical protein
MKLSIINLPTITLEFIVYDWIAKLSASRFTMRNYSLPHARYKKHVGKNNVLY